MLLVRKVTGPAAAAVGETATYRVAEWNRDDVADGDAAAVSWLVKTPGGDALTHLPRHGPTLELEVPASWGGRTAVVMPYMNSPTTRIAVRTEIAAAAPDAPVAPVEVEVIREGKRLYASVDGAPRFFLGKDVGYLGRRGLMNTANPPGPVYRAEDYQDAHGDWAWYLEPTLACESRGSFTCLNTYDRAAFTFGALQFAAHTPRDNFVLLLRELLDLPLAAAYFPDLALELDAAGTRCVHCRRAAGLEPLETGASTQALMDYFNASADTVDDDEAERAARMIDWCVRDPAARALQVDFSVRQFQRKLERHAAKLPLDGLSDKLCLVVLDILHQGRAKYRSIKRALAGNDPFDALLALGLTKYPERIATLRAAIRRLEADGRVGRKVYDADGNRFIVPRGA